MRSFVVNTIQRRLESTVRVLCPIIERQLRNKAGSRFDEYAMRRELVACILGSQVRFEMATTALKRLEAEGLLEERWWRSRKGAFESRVLSVLSGQTNTEHHRWSYRFPKTRAHQIANARDAIAKITLSERLTDSLSPAQLRRCLTTDIAGLGPKQASMLIRNCGKSYDLAILDVHVLHYMEMQNLLRIRHTNVGTVPAYEHTERIAVDYAKRLGYPVGYLDWAIWATMRAARELGV
jgi:N-glycosylase/DNA lyase